MKLEGLMRDVSYGVRSLLRTPMFTVVCVLTLALGIGAATAVFTVIDGVLLRPLAYGDADRLYGLYEAGEAGGIRNPSYPSFQDWERRLTVFESLAYIRGDEFRARGADGTQRLLAAYVSGGFFGTVQAAPLLGRTFGEAGEETNVVVLSHGLWQTRYAGDASVLGRTIATSDGSFTVIGVMPPGFRIPLYADVWVPLRSLPADASFALTRRDLHVDAEAWGLVRPGVSAAQARAELTRVVAGLAVEYPEQSGTWTQATLTPVRERVVGDIAVRLRILVGAVVLVLLIACVNVAGLQLARGSARTRELAVRTVLGAGRGRLVRQLLTESMLLATAGGALGVVLAVVAVDALATAHPTVLPRLDEVGVDRRALLFAAATTMLAAVGFGTTPALRSTWGLAPALREGSGGSGTSARSVRLRGALVVAQVALAVVLTVGSGLLLRSLWLLQRVDPGFTPSGIVALRVFPPARYAEAASAQVLYTQLRDAVRRVPGVADVALTNHAPFAGGWMVTRVLTGEAPPELGDVSIIRTVSREYFEVVGARPLRGRLLHEADFASVGGGIVINDVVARDFFGDADPIGRSVTIFHSAQGRPDFGEPIQATIVGIVTAEKFFSLEGDPPRAVFVPWTWMVWPSITLLARTDEPPVTLLPALRRAVERVDADIPVAGPSQQAQWRPLTDFVAGRLEQRRLMTGLIAAFAASALVLAVLGIFGITAYHVTQRTREIGVRAAIGAPRSTLVALVLHRALTLALLGIMVGVPAAWAGSRLLQSQLFGVATTDPLTIVAAAFVFIGAALGAAAFPTLRALRISPMQALRSD